MNVKTRKAAQRIRECRGRPGDAERVARDWERQRTQLALRPVHPEPRKRWPAAPRGPLLSSHQPPIALRPLRQLKKLVPMWQAYRELGRYGHCRALMSARIQELSQA